MKTPNRSNASGLTLIEIVVVLAVIGIILTVTFPRLQTTFNSNPAKDVTRYLTQVVPLLKANAIKQHQTFSLNINIEQQQLWVTHGAMKPEELETAGEQGLQLDDAIYIRDVQFPQKGKIDSGETAIYFYPKGYCDKALIHFSDDNNQQFTFTIEPFLSSVTRHDEYVGFDGR